MESVWISPLSRYSSVREFYLEMLKYAGELLVAVYTQSCVPLPVVQCATTCMHVSVSIPRCVGQCVCVYVCLCVLVKSSRGLVKIEYPVIAYVCI